VRHCIFLRDKCDVLHRDLKDENILINPADLRIRIIDFGCATEFESNKTYETLSGTPEFFPPEVYTRHRYSAEKLTTWSLGILLYILLFGDLPFDTQNEIINSTRAKVSFSHINCYMVYIIKIQVLMMCIKYDEDVISNESREFLDNMLKQSETDRLTMDQILQSDWLRET